MLTKKIKFSFISCALVLSCLHLACSGSFAQNKKVDLYVQELNTIVNGFEFNDPNFKNTFLLDKGILNNKLVIGMGEATHGTKEFNNYKAQLIKELVLKGELKFIAYETEYSNSLSLNKYLLSEEKDSVDYYITRKGIYGIYGTREIYNMIKWIKSYNLTKPYKDRVQLLGIDMQDSYALIRKISELFPDFTKLLDKESNTKLEEFKKITYANKLNNAKKEDKLVFKELVNTIKKVILENSKPSETLELEHCLDLLSQSLNLRDYPGFFTKADTWYKNLRDKYMSENVLWLLKNKSNGEKIALWAHNIHISKAKSEDFYSMGYHLKEAIGSQYYSLGFAFNEGSVRIMDFKGTRRFIPFNYGSSTFEQSYEFIFKNCNAANFFLDINVARQNTILATFFEHFPYSRIIGAVYQSDSKKDYFKQPLMESYDGLIFFRTTTAAENIIISK